MNAPLDHENDMLPPELRREILQDLAINVCGWARCLAEAAYSGSPADMIAIWRKARQSLLDARAEIRALAEQEGDH